MRSSPVFVFGVIRINDGDPLIVTVEAGDGVADGCSPGVVGFSAVTVGVLSVATHTVQSLL